MTAPRIVSVVLLGLAIGAGTLADEPYSHAPLMLGGYRVLAADFHTHSSTWSDGTLTPWGLVLEAERQGLDAIAITGHNQVSDGQLGRRFSQLVGGPIVLPGEEILAEGRYHMIAAGLSHRVDFHQSAASAIEEIHRQGGIAIAAHPFQGSSAGYDAAAMQRLDGAEICHPGVFAVGNGQRELEQFAARGQLAAIGSSDFHGLSQMGLCRTYVFATDYTEPAILDAVRARRTIVFGQNGKAYGHPELLRYAVSLADRAPPSRSRGNPLDWLSRVAGIVGLTGIAAYGRRRDAGR
jgi:hypothetical protein